MTPEQWRKLQGYFEDVLQKPLEDRPAALAAAEAKLEDDGLRNELRRLVEHAEPDSEFLRPVDGIREALERGRTFEVGDVLANRFEIVRFIGRGGMGTVFEAFDKKLKESVAIKTIAPEYALDPSLLERFQREAQIARRITHPNVCRIHDVGEHDGTPYLTMELMQGETLRDRIARGPLTAEEWLTFARQLLEGLRAAHEVGIIHRDLKPANLMISGSRLVILDFGLARPLISDQASNFSQPGMILGTPQWMAPEQLIGEGDQRSDLYSAALILIHAISEDAAAQDQRGLANVVRRAIGASDITKQLPAALPASWRPALLACLELDPGHRPSSASEVLGLVTQDRVKQKHTPAISKRAAWLVGISIAIALCVALFVLGLRYLDNPVLVSGSTVLIVPTMNVTGVAQFDATSTVLNNTVAQSARFNLWDSQRLPTVLRAMRLDATKLPTPAEWREVAFRENAGMTCFSTLSPLGGGFSLGVDCEHVGSAPESPFNQKHSEFRATDSNDVYGAVREAAEWIRRGAGEGLQEISANNRLPQDITSPSWEALSLYQQAQTLFVGQFADAKIAQAMPLLERAVQKDPQFAMALMALADYSNALGDSEKGFAYWRKAIDAAKAQRLSDHERVSIEGRYGIEIRDYAAAEPVLREWVQRFPNDRRGPQYLAVCLMSTGRFDEGTQLARSFQERFEPSTFGTSILIRGLGAMNRPDEMDEVAKTLVKLSSPTLALRFNGMAAAMRQDYVGAEKIFRQLIETAGGDEASRARGLLAHLVADAGRMDEASKVLDEAIVKDRAEGRTAAAARKAVAAAYLKGEAGNHTLARAMAQDATAQDPSPYVIIQAVSLLARNGFPNDAEQAMKKFTAEQGPYFESNRLRMRGEILIARGRTQEGLDMLEKATQLVGTHAPQEYFARALDLAGHQDQARLLYQQIAKDRWYIWGSPESVWPGTRYRAEAYTR